MASTKIIETTERISSKKPGMDDKLKKGEVIAKEVKNGIVVLKWLDTGNVGVLTTKYVLEMVDINVISASTRNNKQKALLICAYNKDKIGTDIFGSNGLLCNYS